MPKKLDEPSVLKVLDLTQNSGLESHHKYFTTGRPSHHVYVLSAKGNVYSVKVPKALWKELKNQQESTYHYYVIRKGLTKRLGKYLTADFGVWSKKRSDAYKFTYEEAKWWAETTCERVVKVNCKPKVSP